MWPSWTYWMWITGSSNISVHMALDPAKTYLSTGCLTLKDGGDWAHVFISTLCHRASSDQILCGIRDDTRDNGVTEVIANASRVTVTLSTRGGTHRAEGAIYEL